MQKLDIAGYPEVRAEARGICAEVGDRACVAAAFRIEANYSATTGAPAKARPLYAAVLDISNQLGNQLETLNGLTGIAYTKQSQGDLSALPHGSRIRRGAVGTRAHAPPSIPQNLTELTRDIHAAGNSPGVH